jgi:lantibiotic biosynthesis protein
LAVACEKSWLPILTGPLAAEAGRTVEEVAGTLRGLPAATAEDATVDAELALFLSVAAEVLGREDLLLEARRRLDRAVASAGTDTALYGGFPGIAWVAEHSQDRLGEVDLSDVDLALEGLLDQPSWRGDFDLVRGLVGWGVYAIERGSGSSSRRILDRVLAHLDAASEVIGDGLAWRTQPWRMRPDRRKAAPGGLFDLGLAHGQAGVLAFLVSASFAGALPETCARLAHGCARWLIAQELSGDLSGRFPAMVHASSAPSASRDAWCYGTPGIALALLMAARAFDVPDWEVHALRLMRSAAARAPAASGVLDAMVCHGAVGLAHLFNRFYQATGEADFRRAAVSWFAATLTMRRPDGLAGFRKYSVDDDGAPVWKDDPGFLSGCAGIGLSLLAAVSHVEPAWDRLLLVDLRPRA